MTIFSSMKAPLVLLITLSIAASSNAAVFNFHALRSSNDPIGPGLLYPDDLPGRYSISNDWVGVDSLTYTVDGIKVVATGMYDDPTDAPDAGPKKGYPVQDRSNPLAIVDGVPADGQQAGLGVYKSIGQLPPDALTGWDLGDDNIDAGEKLILTFPFLVRITQMVLRSNGHNDEEWLPTSTFLFNGVSMPLSAPGVLNGSWTGTQFTFMHSGGPSDPEDDPSVIELSDDFYLRTIVVERVGVPDSGTTAALLGFALLVGLGLRRRFQ